MKNMDKTVMKTNQRLKNYCSQNDVVYISNTNKKEDCLGVKKLQLNRKSKRFAKNLVKYLNKM